MKQVRIINDTGVAQRTRFIDVESGVEIPGIARATVHFELDDVVRADLILTLVNCEIEAVPRFLMINLKTGKFERVLAIEFESGRHDL